METAVELFPLSSRHFEHGYDAMDSFLRGEPFVLATGAENGYYIDISCYPEGTEFLIHYAKIINDYAYNRTYPRADRQFSIRFKKPITKTN